jgi:hypothetical protein
MFGVWDYRNTVMVTVKNGYCGYCAIFVTLIADSGHNGLPEPPAWKIHELITELKTFTRVVEKNNLGRLLK